MLAGFKGAAQKVKTSLRTLFTLPAAADTPSVPDSADMAVYEAMERMEPWALEQGAGGRMTPVGSAPMPRTGGPGGWRMRGFY